MFVVGRGREEAAADWRNVESYRDGTPTEHSRDLLKMCVRVCGVGCGRMCSLPSHAGVVPGEGGN